MCGIAGFIGQSHKPKVSYELITQLFDFLEIRGVDAAGAWGTEIGDGRIVYHKDSIRSSEFIKTDFWKDLRTIKLDMLIVHARATSRGGGHASKNSNNHPFVSQDYRIGMVHNGTIEEASFLKERYQTFSETDSECLLRIFEHGMDDDFDEIEGVPSDIANRMSGIKKIWSYISTGAMAVALGERISAHRRELCLFRNDKRPLWLADLRSVLGQVFFFSSPEIWYRAIAGNDNLKKTLANSQKLIEIPADQAWFLGIDNETTTVTENSLFKFKLNAKTTGTEFVAGELRKIKSPVVELDVLTPLDAEDELPVLSTSEEYTSDDFEYDHFIDSPRNNEEVQEHEEICCEIERTITDISVAATNLCFERSMSPSDYNQLIDFLAQILMDAKGTLQILRG
jgi:glucosamine 6-phosphate synthetase-like amidotransferase/phosphosugar isomerase protein